MTTIAFHYKDKQIAVDSRITCAGIISTDNFNKLLKNDIGLWIFCGSTCDYEALCKLGHNEKSELEPNCSAMLIRNNKVFGVSVIDGLCLHSEYKYNNAFGSGQDFALSAMDFGKSAKEAVEYAMTRDVYTGGKVQVINVETGEVI